MDLSGCAEVLLEDVDGGAERSVVLQPVEERSHSLRQRGLQLRDVTLQERQRRNNALKSPRSLVDLHTTYRQGKFNHTALFNTRQFKVLYTNERH